MEKFTASNGIVVLDHGDDLSVGTPPIVLTPLGVGALREFFQHERDQELGWWRWPEDPSYVVVRVEGEGSGRHAVVLSEKSGFTYGVDEGREDGGPQFRAGKAYFDSHPEPKPWHDAKDAEHWLIYFSDFPDDRVSALVQGGKFIYNDPCHAGFAEVDDPEIVRAERKWPEVE